LLYGGAKIKVEGNETPKERKALKAEFEAIVRPKPNRPFSVLDPNYLFIKLLKKQKISLLKPKWRRPVYYSKVDLNTTN
jgi:hypothetical protein